MLLCNGSLHKNPVPSCKTEKNIVKYCRNICLGREYGVKKITQMFPRVGTSTIMNTLDKHHISIEEPEKTTFSDVNLVTGPNGAGKTRLLNALLELYQKVQDVEILYG